MNINKKLVIIIPICSILIFSSLLEIKPSKEYEKSEDGQYYANSSAWVTFPYYVHLEDMCGEGDVIYWSFSGSVTSIGIVVLIMDYDNWWWFDNYDLSWVSEYWILSDGSNYADSGWCSPPRFENWVLVFWNADHGTTYLTYNIDSTVYGDIVALT